MILMCCQKNALNSIERSFRNNKGLSGKIQTNKVKVKHADPENIDTPCFSQNTLNDMKKCILSNQNMHEDDSAFRSATTDV